MFLHIWATPVVPVRRTTRTSSVCNILREKFERFSDETVRIQWDYHGKLEVEFLLLSKFQKKETNSALKLNVIILNACAAWKLCRYYTLNFRSAIRTICYLSAHIRMAAVPVLKMPNSVVLWLLNWGFITRPLLISSSTTGVNLIGCCVQQPVVHLIAYWNLKICVVVAPSNAL